MRKKRFLLLLLASFFLFLLAARSSTYFLRAALAERSSKTTITFWHAMSGPRGKALEGLVEEFNKTHSDILVKAEFKGSSAPYANNYDVLIQELLASLRQSNPPVISQVYENWTAQFIGVHALVPLEKFANGKDGYKPQELRDFVPAFLKANKPGGKLWTLPFNKSLYVLYYNKDLFKKARLLPPKTWDDFKKAAQAMTIKDKDGNVTQYGFVDPPNVDLFGLVFYAFGGDYFKNGKADFNGLVGQSALSLVQQMSKEKIFLPDYEALKYFASGKAAMYIDTTAALPYLSQLAQFPVGLAPAPREVHPVALFAGTNLAVFSHATESQQKAAWIFIKWILEPSRTAQWSIQTGYLPVRSSAIKLPVFKSYLARDSRLLVPLAQLNSAFTDPRVWAWESIRGFVDQGVEKAISEKADIKKALDEAAERTDVLLAQQQ